MKKLQQLLTLNIEYSDNLSYRRIILVVSTLFITFFVFIFFGTMHLLVTKEIPVAALDYTAAVISLFAIYHLHRYKNIKKSAKIATLNLMFFFLSFIYINGSAHFAMIWTIFLPIFATLTNGKNVGLYFSLFFYALLLPLAFNHIGVWQEGSWLLQDWVRLTFASLILVFAMYMNESAHELSDNVLAEVRQREQAHINELNEKAITDQLTGLYNRRYYNEMMPKLLSLAQRKDHYITFFILDIDYFKNYNDCYGHIKGDETLIKVANAIKKHIQRGDDFVFRLGGEEFAGIILSEDHHKTHEWIMQTCKIIEDLKIEHSDSQTSQYVTASIGVATICHEKNYNMDHLYSFADKALYLAKDAGRNRSKISVQCA